MLAVVYSIESKGKKGIPYIYIIQDWIMFKLKSQKSIDRQRERRYHIYLCNKLTNEMAKIKLFTCICQF